ncbi:MAG: glycosyltransferase family 4 protein [Candidatus Odinarchaeia archaeon]
MRILLLTSRVTGLGGIERFSFNLKRYLIENHHSVEVISADNTFHIPVKGVANITLALSASLKCINRDFDIVHAMNVPYLVPAKFAKGKKILTMHGFYLESFMMQHKKMLTYLVSRIVPRLLKNVNVITVVSKHAQKLLEDTYGLKSVYIPNAIDTRKLPGGYKKYSDIQILFSGRLYEVKGTDILIKAMSIVNKKYPNAKLIVAGEGREKNGLIKLAKKLCVNAVFLGNLKWENNIRVIRGSEIVVIPSRKEGLPTIALESMAIGKPIIATNVGGLPELITNKKTGILIPPHNERVLAEKIVTLIEKPSLRKQIGENAKRKIKENYDWSVVYPKYEKLYRQLSERK